MLMNNLSVADKKRIIEKLARTYNRSTLTTVGFHRLEAGLEERLHNGRQQIKVPMWGRIALAVAVLLAVTVGIGIFVNAPKTTAVTAIVASVTGHVTTDNGKILTTWGRLAQGESLTTDASGGLTVALGEHQLEMQENSKLSLEQLTNDALQFRVKRGKTRFSIAKLKRRESLQVRAGDVIVHVVGTRFTVANDGQCVTVAVTEGKVKTVRGKQSDFIAAGGTKQYCDSARHSASDGEDNAISRSKNHGINAESPKRSAPPVSYAPDQSGSVPQTITAPTGNDDAGALPGKAPLKAHQDTEMSAEAPRPVMTNRSTGNSEEVLLFDNAHKALTMGALSTAAALFQEYLDTYPRGVFSEDAAFRLVRIAFRQSDSIGVLEWSDDFMSDYPKAPRHRMAEVRILRARILIQGDQYRGALDTLAPLCSAYTKQTPRHQHQITALQFTAACDAGVTATCTQWTNRYLTTWPDGPFAASAKSFQKK